MMGFGAFEEAQIRNGRRKKQTQRLGYQKPSGAGSVEMMPLIVPAQSDSMVTTGQEVFEPGGKFYNPDRTSRMEDLLQLKAKGKLPDTTILDQGFSQQRGFIEPQEGMYYLGGSPNFNEATGERYNPDGTITPRSTPAPRISDIYTEMVAQKQAGISGGQLGSKAPSSLKNGFSAQPKSRYSGSFNIFGAR